MKKHPTNIASVPIDPPDGELPEGWVNAKIDDLLEIKYGKGLKGETRKRGNVEVYGSNGVVGQHDAAITSGPTIIIGRKGTVGAVHWSPYPCWPIDTTYYFEDFHGLHGPFLYYVFRTLGLTELDTSSAIPGLNRDDIYKQLLPLPPLAEQKRIVAKLEELLARVNAARENLSKLPAILKRFRQAVLAAACSGRLTAEWRATNPMPKIEHRELSESPSDSESVDIPYGWRFVDIETVLSRTRRGMKTGPFGSALKKAEHLKEGIPVLGIENIRNGNFAAGCKIHISRTKAIELAEYDAMGGDIIISRSGTVGDACVVPSDLGEARISTNIIRLTLDHAQVEPVLFAHLLNGSPFVLDQVHTLCGGSTRDFLNQTILQMVKFPLPPLPEQHEIVRRVSRLFAFADSIEKQVVAGTARAEKLTQAILAKAFRGELVPTEAELARREGRTYEPAAALLARIGTDARPAPQVSGPLHSNRHPTETQQPRVRGGTRPQ